MLPHLALSRSKCSAVVNADCAALERLPDVMAPAAARRRALAVILGDDHHRESGNPDAPARCAGTTGLPEQPIAAQAAPDKRPRPLGPRKERGQPSAAASSRAPGHRHIAAHVLSGGRMPSASIVPPASCPCRPSTFRLSRSPQPSSRRDCPIPPPATPRGILRSRSAATPQPAPAKTPCHIQTTTSNQSTDQDPYTQNPQHCVLPPA